MYNYSFHHDEKVELGLSAGLYFADIKASFNADLTCTSTTGSCAGITPVSGGASSTLIAPFPTIGFLLNYKITPRLKATGRFDWFYVETATFKGSMSEMLLGLEYRLFKHFGLGAAFNRLNVELDYDSKKGDGWSLENDWNTLYFYGALYF